ncbi:hypothetical protein NKDENANG_01818 [Candidatus Entotheonellaceae bacterium PAL068K]
MPHDAAGNTPRRQQFAYIQRQFHLFRRHNITITKQALVMVAVCAFVLYSILFTNVPTIHDVFHDLRHVLGIIPCH